MSKLQELLDARWPITTKLIPHQKMMNEMLRDIFTDGYNAAVTDNLKNYGNTLHVSVADGEDGTGETPSDLMLEGNAQRIAGSIAIQMQRHPELLQIIENSIVMYDNLEKTPNNG